MGDITGSHSNALISENSVSTAPGGGPSHYSVFDLTQGPMRRGVGVKAEGGGASQNLRANGEDVQVVAVEGRLYDR